MREHVKIMFREEEVNQRIQEVADQINRDYGDTPLHLICILKGGAMFMCELAKRLTMPVSFDFMSVSSYSGTESSGIVRIVKDLDESLENKHVLIVEDIVTTGGSIKEVIDVVKAAGAVPVAVSMLVDRSGGKATFGDVPATALLTMDVETYTPEHCPLCAKGIPMTKRGRTGK